MSLKKKVFLYILALLITGCTIGGVDVEQESASVLAGELLDGHSYGQTFRTQYDGLYRLDLYTATYARENTNPVLFRICTSPTCGNNKGDGKHLVHIELSSTQISNSGPTVITFPPLTKSAGRTLYFSIESPGSIPGDAITVYREEKDIYLDGEMYIDGQPVGGDIAFIAYTQESFTPTEIWKDFYSRASKDKSFFIFYCSLLVLLIMISVLTLALKSRRITSPSAMCDSQKPSMDKESNEGKK